MTEIRNYEYHSVLAPYIQDYIAEKRSLGFIYNVTAYQLKRLDEYWINNGYTEICITAEMLDKWICCLKGESKSSHGGRVSAVKGFAVYLVAMGIKCYVPLLSIGKDYNTVHVLSHTEIIELFDVIDGYAPNTTNACDIRMANEYPIIFRLYYCCGMRNNEVCALETANVDLDTGIITILDGKNQKDRLVYLSEDLRQLINRYLEYITRTLGYKPVWLFPGRNPKKHVGNTQIDKVFGVFWNNTKASNFCDKKPTPHCLRHTYVVDRINSWVLLGEDINVLFPYLSRYLGHKNPDETFYYYHIVNDAFKIIQQKDTKAAKVLPEVKRR